MDAHRRTVRRMPRMQVYLPAELFQQVKARGLKASELLQQAVRAELKRQDLLSETDAFLEELTAEVGAPSAEDYARAEAVVQRLASHPMNSAG